MRFEFAYGRLTPLTTLVGLGRKRSWVDVGPDTVTVRMGWSFRASIARADISAVTKLDKKVISIGVHGWGGRWLVNGAGDRLVKISIDPETKARVIIPVRLRELTMSIEDRDGLVLALGA